jgi:hypothetical protein
MENKFPDFYSLLGNYNKEPLDMCGTTGEMFTLDKSNPIIVTSDGKKLFEERPELFLEVLCDVPRDKNSYIGCGFHGEVYKIGFGNMTLAEKRYIGNENGIDQMKEMAEASQLVKKYQEKNAKAGGVTIRIANAYCATTKKLLMENLGMMPTWQSLVDSDPKMNGLILNKLRDSGLKGVDKVVQTSFDSKFVNIDPKTGNIKELIYVDPDIVPNRI